MGTGAPFPGDHAFGFGTDAPVPAIRTPPDFGRSRAGGSNGRGATRRWSVRTLQQLRLMPPGLHRPRSGPGAMRVWKESVMKLHSWALRAASLVCALATAVTFGQAGSAHASGASGTVVLPDAVSFEYFGLNFADNIRTSNTVGTLDYSGHPGCGGVCSATTQLGASPSVSATVNEVVFEHTSGGGVLVDLGYYVEYLNAPGTYTVNLHAIDSLSAPDGSAVSAYLRFGVAGPSTSSFNNFSSIVFEEADCMNGCPFGGTFVPPGPFVPDHLVKMIANTPYFIQLGLKFASQPSHVQVSGMVDPVFSASTFGGTFIFSPGVFGHSTSVPEPGAWMLMLSGFFAIGALARRRAASSPACA